DGQRFQQVLSNFLSNAVKFSPPDSPVTVRLERVDDRVRVAVTDQGPGIPDDFRDRIFQKFSQADASDTRARGGTGLGLAITKELAERMGGSVGFESAPGQGATFFVEFPGQKTPANSDTMTP
ncbi:MAG: ATP-binding protein, partial [Chromatiaceae bacterium]|nr:ATP-binding protein [Candidatus Thioaporhodococcus sediminis]